MPERVQLSRVKGWRMPPDTVRVCRPGKWGNPFDFRSPDYQWTALAFGCRADPPGRQAASVVAYRQWINPGPGRVTVEFERKTSLVSGDHSLMVGKPAVAGRAPSMCEIVSELRGKNLACWCKPGAPCHADVLLELANG